MGIKTRIVNHAVKAKADKAVGNALDDALDEDRDDSRRRYRDDRKQPVQLSGF